MTRGALLAWCGGAVAVLAIVGALFWPMTAGVTPLPAAGSMTLPTAAPPGPVVSPAVVAPAAEVATTDARGRVVRKPNPAAVAVSPSAAAAHGAAVAPAAVGVPVAPPRMVGTTEAPPTTTTPAGNGGLLGGGGGGGNGGSRMGESDGTGN